MHSSVNWSELCPEEKEYYIKQLCTSNKEAASLQWCTAQGIPLPNGERFEECNVGCLGTIGPHTSAQTEKYKTKNYRKEENGMGDEVKWSYYSVKVVDKINFECLIDETNIPAKNKKQALGKAGYFGTLEKFDYDESKVAVKVKKILEIRPSRSSL